MDCVYKLAEEEIPDAKIYAGTSKFGTYRESLWGTIHSLRTSILENHIYQNGGSSDAKAWGLNEYRELFMLSKKQWLKKAIADARKAFTGIFTAENFLTKFNQFFPN